jgi:hypothetical protein
MEVPVSLVALLPPMLELITRGLETLKLLGGNMVRKKIRLDHRPVIKKTFVDAPNGGAILDALKTYFTFDAEANEIIKLHISFIVSLYFAAIEKSREFFKIEGWPVAGLIVVSISFFIFSVYFFRDKFSPTSVEPFKTWRLWTWALFIAILAGEGGERLAKL